MWLYKGQEFTAADVPEDAVGFVYVITNLETGKKYLGKKNFFRVIVRPPLKGMKKKRRETVQSDWLLYVGSSETVKAQVAELGLTRFRREILAICYSKGMLSYMEAKMQFDMGVLFDDNYLNGIIQVRINRSHVIKDKKTVVFDPILEDSDDSNGTK